MDGESPVMASTGGFASPKVTSPSDSRYWRWPSLMQDVEPEGGFARAGQTGQDDELVLGDRQGDVFQVVQPCAANGDLSRHLTSRYIDKRRSERRLQVDSITLASPINNPLCNLEKVLSSYRSTLKSASLVLR